MAFAGLRRQFSTFSSLFTGLQRLALNSSNLPAMFQPPINRSMRELDRSFFRKVIPTSAVTVSDPKQISMIKGALTLTKEVLLLQGVRPVFDDGDDDSTHKAKCILLRPEVKADQPTTWSARLSDMIDDGTVSIRPHDLVLTYDNWTTHNILEAVLPESTPDDQQEIPTGFAQAGHIAHVNLRYEYEPWKYLIGQVIIDKNATVRTVINKTLDVGSESEFRTFPFEILAGDNDVEVTQSEQGCEFRFSFTEVYWNSRLGNEHERMVDKFKPGEAVCDVMAGVGPFAVPAGKKKVFVRANDLNPHSYDGLKWAIQRNKVTGLVTASCLDGRAFIKKETARLARTSRTFADVPNLKVPRHSTSVTLEELALKRQRETVVYVEPPIFSHYVMNLPATAIEFLDAFQGLYRGRELEFAPHTEQNLPMIHVYTFQARRETTEEEIEEVCVRVSLHLGSAVKPDDPDVEVVDVRLVSPKKKFYCASFRLPAEVAFARYPENNRRSNSTSSNESRSQSPIPMVA